jgi:hypothetical protein
MLDRRIHTLSYPVKGSIEGKKIGLSILDKLSCSDWIVADLDTIRDWVSVRVAGDKTESQKREPGGSMSVSMIFCHAIAWII